MDVGVNRFQSPQHRLAQKLIVGAFVNLYKALSVVEVENVFVWRVVAGVIDVQNDLPVWIKYAVEPDTNVHGPQI